MAEMLSLKNFYDTIVNGLFEIRNTHKTNTSLKAKIKYVYSNNNIETYWGFTDASNTILFVPILMLVRLNPIPYFENGIKTFYISANQEDCLDLNKFGDIANAVTQEAIISLKHLRTWQELKISNVKGTINLNLFDNIYASDFGVKSFKITASKVLEFLNEVPKRVFILSCIVSGLFGGFVFSFITAVIFLIIIVLILAYA